MYVRISKIKSKKMKYFCLKTNFQIRNKLDSEKRLYYFFGFY